MNLLLDTHVFLWWMWGEDISSEAAAAISDPETIALVSAASVWEIAIKRALGKLEVPDSIEAELEGHGFRALTITAEHAERAGGLPLHHRDPFDRMLVAQAQMEGLTLVTRDPAFAAYDVRTLAC